MKITERLTVIASDVEFEAAKTEAELKEVFAAAGIAGFKAELDIAERTEDHVQVASLDELMGFAKAAGVPAVTYDVTYFPAADSREVTYQLRQVAHDLDLSVEVIRNLCADEIAEYLAEDEKRDTEAPVHSIVEVYYGGTALAWYGVNEYPRLKKIILRKLAQGGQQAKRNFILQASKAQVDLDANY